VQVGCVIDTVLWVVATAVLDRGNLPRYVRIGLDSLLNIVGHTRPNGFTKVWIEMGRPGTVSSL
jgi:hypothetical protein